MQYHAKACNDLRSSFRIIALASYTASFKEMLQQWQAVDNTVFDLPGLRLEFETSHSRDNCLTK